MPLINDSHDSLPYIDPAPTASERARAQQLINAELSPEHASTMHPLIPEAPEPKFSQFMQQELARKAQGAPLTGGIDLSRYEAPEAPTPTPDNETPDLAKSNQILQQAYVSCSYLSERNKSLGLLEEFGKNAWLVGNSQLEEVLGSLEKELAETKAASEEVNKQRKITQEASQGELVSLEETWKRGPGAILNVELASESLRRQNLDYRRQLAQQQAHS